MTSDSSRWEHFEHKADIGIRGIGATIEEAFIQAANALTAVVADPGQIASTTQVDIMCQAPDIELLLVDWLNAVIFEMATRDMLFSSFTVAITGTELTGSLWGEKADVIKHQPAVEIKGATYTALSVSQDQNGLWTAQCVVDV